jgi:glycosyltransferase involved in cell wall biosynthesis
VRPIRVLELRSVRGTGGGPEKTILLGAAGADASRVAVTVCYIRDERDPVFAVDDRARAAGVDYVEIRERHSLDPRIWPPLRALVLARGIDIVHAHDYKTDLLAWLLARRTGVLPLSTAHGWTGHSPRERRVYYPIDKRILGRFPRVIAVSSQVRDELVGRGVRAGRVRVVLNGIDPCGFRRERAREAAARTSFGFGPSDVIVAAVGRLAPQKRFDVLIAAFESLARRRLHLRLAIAGDGTERLALERLIATSGLAGRIRLLGHLDDVRELHHAANLFVQSADYEGTPNAVLEAMALEVPIVATDAGGTSELLRPTLDGLVVPPGDPRALAGAMADVLDDPAGAVSRTRAARRRVETDLSFATRMERVEAIYAELIRRRS